MATTAAGPSIPLQTTTATTSTTSCSSPHQALSVDFSWKKWKSLITTQDSSSSSSSQPLYTVSYKTLSPNLVFKSALDKSVFGTGTLHPFSIDSDCSLRDQPIQLKAMKRFKTEYSHLSRTFSPSSKEPVQMLWTSSSGWKNWDFICLDASSMPVAKFSANTMSLKNVGRIEFLGEEVIGNEAFKEEIVVVGMTLMYTMVLRSTSFLSLFGALFAKPGRKEMEEEGKGGQANDGKVHGD
ncbi:uncharacterized protein Bfra_001520 [Botrytis fragariae]|uniref:Uncharacterized protein n=1 Tax=Botrytis fragariae TaxID=1964551 RepID=A0A8H6ELZ2_9HELO|nr:uncharacterized protein Bfra_001520 [Botrytis fragariae]KAF5877157.1 hypothetical protein Bfra_001520 [Botrytis fragariae]